MKNDSLENQNINLNSDQDKKISLVEESFSVDKVKEATSEVIVSKDTLTEEKLLKISIDQEKISIEHIPVGRVIEQYPVVREEDGKTIIPVVRERLVVKKELFLEEEIHITKNITTEIQEVKETLRKDVVNIERNKL